MSCRTYLKICSCWELTGITIPPSEIDTTRPPARLDYKLTMTSETVCESGEGKGPLTEGETATGEVSPGGIIQNLCKCRKVFIGEDKGDGEGPQHRQKYCQNGMPNPAKLCGPKCTIPLDASSNDANGRHAEENVQCDPNVMNDGRAGKAWCDKYEAMTAPGSSFPEKACAEADSAMVREMFGPWWHVDKDNGRPVREGPHAPSSFKPPVVCNESYDNISRMPPNGSVDIDVEPNPPEDIQDNGCQGAWISCGNQTQQK